MTNPVTPNIGLNKIDRTSPSTTYFDLEKYIDQNADAIDRFAGQTSESIDALEKRLDTEERREVVLQPGLQIVNAERRAPFKLSGIKGRTLVNLAGRQTSRTVNSAAAATINVGLGSTGSNTQTINVDIKNTDEAYISYNQAGGTSAFKAVAGKYYVILVDVKINSISGAGQIKVGGSGSPAVGAYTVDKTKTGVWQRVCHRFRVSSDSDFSILAGTCYAGGVFATANFDIKNISFYEISQSDYDNLWILSEKELAEKYPYADSVTPVRNPYSIRYGDNLAPTLYEGTVSDSMSMSVISRYSALIKATGLATASVQYSSSLISAIPNTTYTLRGKVILNDLETYTGVYVDVMGYDEEGRTVLDTLGTSIHGSGIGVDTFDTPSNIKTMQVRIVTPENAEIGDYIVENIMLTLGSTSKPFKPREDSILALQTDLYADPVTGACADEVFEKDGQYFRLAKWNRKVLDGSINWVGSFPFTGFKSVRYPLTNVVVRSAIGVKYDGKILNEYGGIDAPDKVTVDNDNAYVWISNADSGWGDNYTPTSDEIKAFFMGWTMYDGTGGNQSPNTSRYNGIGTKWWARRSDGISRVWVDATPVLPTVQAPSWTPYQLVYQLANPTVDSIISEGLLTFNEGDNQIEVGTGIVLRERVNPSLDNAKWWNLGNPVANPGSTSFKYIAKQVLSVFMNNVKDFRWKVTLTEKYGALAQLSPIYHFNQLAAYSVTYLKLEKSPDVPLLGTIAVNEKSLLQELVISVQNSTTTISELMRKEEDKKVSDWITPTLLNGWVGHGSTGVSVRKNGGHLEIKGAIRAGVAISGTHIMRLPNELRPSRVSIVGTFSQNSNGDRTIIAVDIWPDGVVVINGSSTSNIGNEFLLMNAFIPLS